MRKKNYTIKFKENSRKWTIFIVIFTLLAFLMSFQGPAKWMGGLLRKAGLNVNGDDVQSVATITALVGLGSLLLITASAFAAVPIVGIGLAVVGLALIAFAGWKAWKWNKRRKGRSTNLNADG